MTTASSTGMSLDSATIMQRLTERFSTRIRFARTSHGVRLQMSKILDATPVSWPIRAPQLSVTRQSTVVARTSPAEKQGACFLPVASDGSTRFQWRYASFESPVRSRSWPGVYSTWCTPCESVVHHTFSQDKRHVNPGVVIRMPSTRPRHSDKDTSAKRARITRQGPLRVDKLHRPLNEQGLEVHGAAGQPRIVAAHARHPEGDSARAFARSKSAPSGRHPSEVNPSHAGRGATG